MEGSGQQVERSRMLRKSLALAIALSLGRAKPAFGSASQNSNSQSAQDRAQLISERIPRPSEFGGLSLADQLAIERTAQKLQQILLTVNSIVSSRRDPVSACLYGIAVHKAFADAVRAENLSGIGWDGVEQSFDLRGLVNYGTDGSIRTDVILRNEEGIIIAIYDVKTGNATMRPSREAKIRKYTKASPFVRLFILHAKRGER